ncbi:MAG: nucleotidyltransferase family protein, partial [Candidatus Methanomethylophilaceae archaeon]
MKAVILAGGFGTRLRPLTNYIAKPLIPLLGMPLVMHIIDSMPSSVDHVIMAVNYRKQDLEDYFQTHDVGVEVTMVEESEPLGTGGALRNLQDHIDDTFLMFNGDVVCSLDQLSMLRHHESKGGMATISLWQVEDPRAFGVVELQQDGRITQFQEKPAPGEEVSNL